ncbi:ACS family 4-hydroxyphenylacetate permease-like MFS transporter [Acinetobacter calcoaceticus]|uniref:ACS family 4-hydroxyphenylacetate permease-like MFS transporter n=1 Tax=Acinetobacter calcoaceticus TaxID=471 RepID=A0A4R1XYN8_ACICA|nr:ACS family 4-hydroxyphenylacetate permease-like MFS transporter [Acinetobacter calcoaceticus]
MTVHENNNAHSVNNHAMSPAIDQTAQQHTEQLNAVIKKVHRKLLYFLLILFIFSFLDRINIGFVGKELSADLGLTALSFGLANTIFYVFYICFGMPSNLMLRKFGTRLWIGLIIIVWGIASSATAFATDEKSLYIIRAIVGIAEAGFMPGMLLYLTQWFPSAHRSRANAIFMLAFPFTAMFGAMVTGFFLNLHDWHGLAGWQWVFILEGMPCVILGLIVFAKLPNTPQDAKWLNAEEKHILKAALEAENTQKTAIQHPSIQASAQQQTVQQSTIQQPTVQHPAATPFETTASETSMYSPPITTTTRPNYSANTFNLSFLNSAVIRCAVVYFCIVTTSGMINIWVPQIVSSTLPQASNMLTGVVIAIPHMLTIVVMYFLSRHSDKTQERYLHTLIPMLLGGLGWLMAVYVDIGVLQLLGLSLACMAGFSTIAIFWAFADESLSTEEKFLGIAFIAAMGNSATIVSSFLVGYLKDLTQSFHAGMLYGSSLMFVGALILLSFVIRRSPQRSAI